MSKLQKFNNVLFALISIPLLILAVGLCIIFLNDTVFNSHDNTYIQEYQGSVSQDVAQKNADKGLQTQYISYADPFILSATNGEYVIPVEAINFEKPIKHHDRFGFFEQSVEEVVFKESSSGPMDFSEEKKEKKSPRTNYSESIRKYTNYFSNLLYNNDENKVTKTLFDTRFTGWNLTFIRVKNERYLAFQGAESDTDKDGFINDNDIGSLYIYDLQKGSLKVITLPNLNIGNFYLAKNTSFLFLKVIDPNRPKERKNEVFIYRYDMLTGKLEDAVPAKEKALHEQLIR